MKHIGTLLLPALLALVVGFSGCTLTQGIVTVEPSTVHVFQWTNCYLTFLNLEPSEVTVSHINLTFYRNDIHWLNVTIKPGDPFWNTGTVPSFQGVIIALLPIFAVMEGSYKVEAVFFTSEGDFSARGGWTVLP